jgi:hypothetical protein
VDKVDISAEVLTPADAEIEGMEHIDSRFKFTLTDSTGQTYEFIVDLPAADENDSLDVWVKDSTVQVGDMPEDGFATFTPNKN